MFYTTAPVNLCNGVPATITSAVFTGYVHTSWQHLVTIVGHYAIIPYTGKGQVYYPSQVVPWSNPVTFTSALCSYDVNWNGFSWVRNWLNSIGNALEDYWGNGNGNDDDGGWSWSGWRRR
jgi:hypothetical protein